MLKFKYVALSHDGSEKRGKIEANSQTEASEILSADGLFATSMSEVSTSSSGDTEGFSFFKPKVKKKELVLFFRQLSVLLRSGVSIVRALNILKRQAKSKGLNRALGSILLDVEEGLDLSEALKKVRGFSPYDISMVKAAEESGELDVIMGTVASQMEMSMEFKGQMLTSLIYPIMVTAMSFIVIILLSVFVVPQFATVLGGKGKSLPLITQWLMNFSDFMQIYWLHIVGGVVGTAVAIPIFKRTKAGSAIIDQVFLRLPIIGLVIQCGIVVNFSRNMSILIRSGVVLSEALLTVRDTLGNAVAYKVISKTYDSIMEGEGMADTLREHSKVFPPLLTEMVATGEETGEMELVLDLTSEIYRKMLETFVKRMNAMIEPLLILIMGGMVGFVVMALMAGVMAMY